MRKYAIFPWPTIDHKYTRYTQRAKKYKKKLNTQHYKHLNWRHYDQMSAPWWWSFASRFTVGNLGDIALPNINYESEWEAQRLNKSFQEELEKLKQEVYHEGLQVEEEGLTDIIRKKTKQPLEIVTESPATDPKTNDVLDHHIQTVNGPKIKENPFVAPNLDNRPENQAEINATIVQYSSNHSNPLDIFGTPSQTEEEVVKKIDGNVTRHTEYDKIQSNSKDIVNHSGEHIQQRRVTVSPTNSPAVRSTLANRFSNAGGNGGHLDDIETLTANGAIRRRHRKRRQGRYQLLLLPISS